MNINLTLIGQMIAFVCFVWFCMKYVWPPILAAMQEREQKIADGLAAADRASHDVLAHRTIGQPRCRKPDDDIGRGESEAAQKAELRIAEVELRFNVFQQDREHQPVRHAEQQREDQQEQYVPAIFARCVLLSLRV